MSDLPRYYFKIKHLDTKNFRNLRLKKKSMNLRLSKFPD